MAFYIPNTPSEHQTLLKKIGSSTNQIVALEPTSGYEWAVWGVLDTVVHDVKQVPSVQVRAFAKATGTLIQ